MELNEGNVSTVRFGSTYFVCSKVSLHSPMYKISPAAIIMTSFNTNLPAPDKYGNPNRGVGKFPPLPIFAIIFPLSNKKLYYCI